MEGRDIVNGMNPSVNIESDQFILAEGMRIFLLVGASGVGKSSLIEQVLKQFSFLAYIPSDTTRSMSPSESQGNPYNFISMREFLNRSSKNVYLETKENYGNLYGTNKELYKKAILSGKFPIKDVDYRGAEDLSAIFGSQVIKVFIDAPNMVINNRKKDRGGREARNESLEHLRDITRCYPYRINNVNLVTSVELLSRIIKVEALMYRK